MAFYDPWAHGEAEFPIGVHDTYLDNGFELYPHLHREVEFLVVTKGHGIFTIGDSTFDVAAGDVVFINSMHMHSAVSQDDTEAEFFAVVFSPSLLGAYTSDRVFEKYVSCVLDGRRIFPVLIHDNEPWEKEAQNVLSQIHTAANEKAEFYEIKTKALLLSLWQLYISHSAHIDNFDREGFERMQAATAFMAQNFAQSITLDDIAQSVHMSRTHFCRVFSHVMHTTAFKYLLRLRLNNACILLRATNKSICEIAQECGFNDSCYFTKAFHKYTSLAPLAYRKAQ